jgi:hypothetical protein
MLSNSESIFYAAAVYGWLRVPAHRDHRFPGDGDHPFRRIVISHSGAS